MSLFAALVLALVGALGTGWIVWLRREHERDQAAVLEQLGLLAAELAALRGAVDALRIQVVALRTSADATRAELDSFMHGPPSMRVPLARPT